MTTPTPLAETIARADLEKVREMLDARSMPEPMTGCALWLGGSKPKGYGAIYLAGATRIAHRVSYEAHVGPIPDGLWVLHRCDTPACINPEHLFLGTVADNHRDMRAKGRQAVMLGEDGSNAKLRTADIPAIRSRTHAGESAASIARDYGVSKKAIVDIASGRTWTTVPMPTSRIYPTKRGGSNSQARLTESDVIAMREQRAAGSSLLRLAAQFGVSASLVSVTCRGSAWSHVGGPITKMEPVA
jgi:hypothetical protein